MQQQQSHARKVRQSKRRKVAQACDQCRCRKVRCDGIKPICGECRGHPDATDCRYSSRLNRDQSHDDYIASLLDRIHKLESKATKGSSLPTTDGSRTVEAGLRPPGRAEAIDAMGSVVDSSLGQSTSPVDYYGSSSTVSFLDDIYTATGHRDVPRKPADSHEPNTNMSTGSRVGLPSTTVLPPRSTMDRLLDTYWRRIHHLYPFVHKHTFQVAYEILWLPARDANEAILPDNGSLGSQDYGPTSTIFHCALNVMAALSCHFLGPQNEESIKLATVFGERARGLCHLDLFNEGSIAFVQTLLLIAQYLQSTQWPSRCWNCVGIACRLAQGMGLHVERPTVLATLTPEQIDMRRRVWHGCVMLDAIVSMTLGRPLMLRKSRIPVPKPQLLGLKTVSQAEIEHPPHNDFFLISINLYGILRDVLSELYGDIDEKAVCYDAIASYDAAVAGLENDLPTHLLPQTHLLSQADTPESEVFKQQAYVLQTRILHLRVLLCRPTFTRFCRDQATLPDGARPALRPKNLIDSTSDMAKAITEHCVIHAIRLVDNIDESIKKCATGAWWYTLFYARTAGVVILFALACPALKNGISELDTAWRTCQTILEHLGTISPRASFCLKQMHALREHIQHSWDGQLQTSRAQPRVDFADSRVPVTTSMAYTEHHLSPGPAAFDFSHDTEFGFDMVEDFDWEAFITNPGI
jgi:hypothetical protein